MPLVTSDNPFLQFISSFPFLNKSFTPSICPTTKPQITTILHLSDISLAQWRITLPVTWSPCHLMNSSVWISSIIGLSSTGSSTITTEMYRKCIHSYTRSQGGVWTKIVELMALTGSVRLFFQSKRPNLIYSTSRSISSSEWCFQCPGVLRAIRRSSEPFRTFSSQSKGFASSILPVWVTSNSTSLV